MKYILLLITIVQALLILIWTAFCGIIGIVFILLTQQRRAIMLLLEHYVWSPFVCAVSLVRVKVTGLENLDRKGKYIFVANHASLFDIAAVCRACPVALFYIAKIELKKIPIMGHYMTISGMIFIDRKNKEKAMESMRRAGESIKAGRNVISFPEGTRSKSGEVGVFKRGSFIIAKDNQIGIVPITIKGTEKILPNGTFKLQSGTVHVHFNPIIHPQAFKEMEVDQIAELARNSIISSRDAL